MQNKNMYLSKTFLKVITVFSWPHLIALTVVGCPNCSPPWMIHQFIPKTHRKRDSCIHIYSQNSWGGNSQKAQGERANPTQEDSRTTIWSDWISVDEGKSKELDIRQQNGFIVNLQLNRHWCEQNRDWCQAVHVAMQHWLYLWENVWPRRPQCIIMKAQVWHLSICAVCACMYTQFTKEVVGHYKHHYDPSVPGASSSLQMLHRLKVALIITV